MKATEVVAADAAPSTMYVFPTVLQSNPNRREEMEAVLVRRRWNAPDAATVPVDALWDLHLRNDAGGVCGAFPRAFLFAHVWCDKLASGELGHFCREGPPPHDLLVCILPTDNPEALYETLRAKVRR
jgi:hypothetical protein